MSVFDGTGYEDLTKHNENRILKNTLPPLSLSRCCCSKCKDKISYNSLVYQVMSGSSNLNSFRDIRQVAVQLVPCGVLPPGLVQDCLQHSCVIAV